MKIRRGGGRHGEWSIQLSDPEMAALHWAAADQAERYPKDRACVEVLVPLTAEVETVILPEALDALVGRRLYT